MEVFALRDRLVQDYASYVRSFINIRDPRLAAELLPAVQRDSLAAWFTLYVGIEARTNAENTIPAKKRDLRLFLECFDGATGCTEVDLWARSITSDFVKRLQAEKRSPTTVNRVLATRRHCAQWIHRRRPFLAGAPTERIQGVRVDDPEWKRLKDVEVTRQLQGEKTMKPYRPPAMMLPYVFASEWAVRHSQRALLVEANREPALDEILCDRKFAARFDLLAARIKPGFSPLEYRWAALGPRKQSRQTPDKASVSPPLNTQLLLDGFDPTNLPELPGLYLIRAPYQPLYVHETENLRDQMTRHLDTAGETLVPDWLLTGIVTPAHVAFTVLSDRNKLHEARVCSVTELQPWLNLTDLPSTA